MIGDEAETSPPGPVARRRRALLATSAAILAPLLVLGAVVWTQRIGITNEIAKGVLAERGVPGSWSVDSLDFGGATLTNIVIGTPGAPTLVVPEARIRWRADLLTGKAILTEVVAERPVVNVVYRNGKLDLGALAPFLTPSEGPSRVDLERALVRDAQVRVATDYGLIDAAISADGNAASGWSAAGNIKVAAQGAAGVGLDLSDIPVSGRFMNRGLVVDLSPDKATVAFGGFKAKGLGGSARLTIDLPARDTDPLMAAFQGTLAASELSGANLTGLEVGLDEVKAELRLPPGGLKSAEMSASGRLTAVRMDIEAGRSPLTSRDLDVSFDGRRSGTGASDATTTLAVATLRSGGLALSRGEVSTKLSGTMADPAQPFDTKASGPFKLKILEASVQADQLRRTLEPLRLMAEGAGPGTAHMSALLAALESAGRGVRTAAEGRINLDGPERSIVALDQPLTLSGPNGLRVTGSGRGTWLTLALPDGRVSGAPRLAINGGGFPALNVDLRLLDAQAGSVRWEGSARLLPWAVGGGSAEAVLSRFDGTISGSSTRVNLAGLTEANGDFSGFATDSTSAAFDVALSSNATDFRLQAANCIIVRGNSIASIGVRVPQLSGRLCPDSASRLISSSSGRSQLFGSLAVDPLTAQIGDGARAQTITIGASVLSAEPGQGDRATRVTLPSVDITYPLANGGKADVAWDSAGGILRQTRSGRWSFDGGVRGLVATGLPVSLKGDAEGRILFGNGPLEATGQDLSLTVVDGEESARFAPIRLSGAATLRENRIEGQFVSALAANGVRLGQMKVTHDLRSGAGNAILDGDGLTFASGSLQPAAIVPPLRGVIADVNGVVEAEARLTWDRTGTLESTGRFATEQVDLATGLGPMRGLSGTVELTDLLGLVSAPDQKLNVGLFNPGIPIENGVVTFALTGGGKIAIADARWPLADGTVLLNPVVWQIGAPNQTVVLDLERVDLERLLGLMNVPDLEMQGRVSGTFPIVVENTNARIVGGRLAADENGGVIRFRNDATTEAAKTNGGAKLAFDALENFEFRILQIRVDGSIVGELQLGLLFEGRNREVLYGMPIRFDMTAQAPFAQLFRSASNVLDSGSAMRMLRQQQEEAARERDKPSPATVDGPAAPAQPEP